MRNGNVSLRLISVLSVAGFIALAASLYEVDRREKSSLATAERTLADIEQQIQILSNQFHILNKVVSNSFFIAIILCCCEKSVDVEHGSQSPQTRGHRSGSAPCAG